MAGSPQKQPAFALALYTSDSFSVVADPGLQTDKRVFRTDQS